jgi:hypothetical protein
VRQTIDIEKRHFASWIVQELRREEARQAGAGLKLFRNFLEGSEGTQELAKTVTFVEAVKLTEDLLPIYDDLARFVALPKKQFDAEYPAFKAKTKAAYPLAGTILPSVDSLLGKEQRHKARLAMLLAALEVARGGPAALKSVKDPFGDGAFAYRSLERGFELQSQLIVEGQPVTLKAGQASRK